MIKEYCDICGNKAKTKKYYLPKRKDNGNVVKTKKYICQECESILDVFANNFKSLAKGKNIYYCTSRYRISVEDNRHMTYPFICRE